MKPFLGALAVALTFAAFLPYILAILRGAVRPHVFTWVIWGTTTLVVFFAQHSANAGAGSWATGVSSGVSFLIAVLAYRKRADGSILPVDWVFFLVALSALPFWYLTDSAAWAVVILTTVDLLGFGPTLRNAYAAPRSESRYFFGMLTAQNALILLALDDISLTTALFPAAVGVGCLAVTAVLVMRRRNPATAIGQP